MIVDVILTGAVNLGTTNVSDEVASWESGNKPTLVQLGMLYSHL